ncbi:hypothetical protein CEXT_367741 [Caerostris extrusa]|uniref:Uncharacterized protein n=1 Tax=Caerostris extrusa TaxID=172846 RepID=A0AAV4RHM1_CAEEX|nr:hypothetical protein CEXT_367741 [Caerostris extrusa]
MIAWEPFPLSLLSLGLPANPAKEIGTRLARGWPGRERENERGRVEEKILTDQVRRQTQTRSGPWKMFQTANTQHAPNSLQYVDWRVDLREKIEPNLNSFASVSSKSPFLKLFPIVKGLKF